MTAKPYRIARIDEIPADLAPGAPFFCTETLLDGELVPWDGPLQMVRSPITVQGVRGPDLQLLGACPAHGPEDGERALAAALAAWDQGLGDWPCRPAEERIACVEEFRRLMAERRAEIVRFMVWEICKSRKESEQEFDRTLGYLDDTVAALRAMLAQWAKAAPAGSLKAVQGRSPLGVALCMGPFNFPLNETLATLIPALIMGNTAVVKLPRIGRMLFTPLLECFRRAFARGVVNVLCGGIEVVEPALTSGKVDVLAFIGTSRAAEALRALHPHPNRLRCVLGMEAKNAAIVLADADLETALPEIVRGAFGFNGQRCTAIKLIFVAKPIAQEFLDRFALAAANLRVGLPWEPQAAITPLPEPGKPAFLAELLRDAVNKGARAVNAGGALDEVFFAPTVVAPVTPQMRIFHEEQFGPLAPVAFFDTPEEALRAIAGSPYGQQVSIFGRDAGALAGLSHRLRNLVSRVNINCKCQRGPDTLPFTARGDSAVGTLSVVDGLRAFSLPTLAVARDAGANQEIIAALEA
jgi:glyceraldehyde-3-phosphate dehydrogenase (NADP+)